MTAKTVWLDGNLVDWDDATVHVTSFGLHYGIGFFEGIGCHSTPDGPAIFRLADHVRRLQDSAAIYGVPLPYPAEEFARACKSVVAANGLADCYVRPLIFLAEAADVLSPRFRAAVIASDHGPLGGTPNRAGSKARISSFQRISSNVIPPTAKATGQYLNSFLAQTEALSSGCDEAILLNAAGFVTDGWAHNVFIVRNGALATPPVSAGALPGITRHTVMTLAADAGLEAREEDLVRSDLYLAQECFLTGTAAGIVPVTSVDRRRVGTGQPGPVTRMLTERLDEVVHGVDRTYPEWLDYLS